MNFIKLIPVTSWRTHPSGHCHPDPPSPDPLENTQAREGIIARLRVVPRCSFTRFKRESIAHLTNSVTTPTKSPCAFSSIMRFSSNFHSLRLCWQWLFPIPFSVISLPGNISDMVTRILPRHCIKGLVLRVIRFFFFD